MGTRWDSGVRLSLWFCDLGQVSLGLRFSFFLSVKMGLMIDLFGVVTTK